LYLKNIHLNQKINLTAFGITPEHYQLFIKRDDLFGDGISGNKLRKLKYNLIEAQQLGYKTALTFGGAYSNHILAASFIKKKYNLNIIGVIRGEELIDKIDNNPTLKAAQQNGMQFHFVTREAYRNKTDAAFIQMLKNKFGDFYLLPEGGTNSLAIKGCEEILTNDDFNFNYVTCAVGTGGTVAGIINSSKKNQQVIGFSALKGDFLKDDVSQMISPNQNNWSINIDYHFGGYAKINEELIHFMNDFKEKTGIQLDSIYNGKMLFGIIDLLKKGYFKKNTSILAIHTGGLQSIEGMNELLKRKKLPLIQQ